MLKPNQNGRDFQSAIWTMITEGATYRKKVNHNNNRRKT
jgi:hypothetical protein